jgi:hypothetical protein
MKIYLSGASKNIELCEQYRDQLLAAGHTLAHDWMKGIRDHGGVSDADTDRYQQKKIAQIDLRAATECQIFWLLLPTVEIHTIGAWVELGAALTSNTSPVIIVSGPWRSIFETLADHRFSDHRTAAAWILNRPK